MVLTVLTGEVFDLEIRKILRFKRSRDLSKDVEAIVDLVICFWAGTDRRLVAVEAYLEMYFT